MPRHKVLLPKWASLVEHDPSIGEDPVSIQEEEAYIRTRCYYETSRAIDRALTESLDHLATNVIGAIGRTEGCNHSSTDEGSPPTSKRARLDIPNGQSQKSTKNTNMTSESSLSISLKQKFAFTPSRTFHPSLLPVHLVSGPLNLLDRLAWTRHFVETEQRQSKGAIVWLQSGPPTMWVTETIRQILVMEPLRQTTGTKGISPLENLQLWCRSTLKFSFIRIYIDIQTVASSVPPVNQFLNWLANARSSEGIPFSVVLFETVGIRCHDICAYEQGSDGFLINRHVLGSADSLIRHCLTNKLVTDAITVLLESHGKKEANVPLWALYESTGSFVNALLEWKKRLADYLSSPGTFLMLDYGTWLVKERRRLTWMLSKEHLRLVGILKDARSSLSEWQNELRYKRTLAVLSWKLRHLVVGSKCNLPNGDVAPKVSECCKSYLELVAEFRNDLDSEQQDVLASTNELIILLGSCSSNGEMLQCIQYYQHMWTDLVNRIPLRHPITRPFRLARYRRDVADGMLATNEATGVVSIVSILFNALRNRVTISLSEWLESVLDEMGTTLPQHKIVAYFCVGVNCLKVQGLVRERRIAGRKEPIFVKAVVVFCSGA
jgi:hypothetical protein